MSTLFSDLNKQARELLCNKKKYIIDGAKKFSLKTKTANDVEYKAEAKLSGNSVSGKVGTSFTLDSGFNVKKLELNNNGVLESEILLNKAVEDVQFKLKVKLEPLKKDDPVEESIISAKYSNGDITADLSVSPFQPTTADFSLCMCRDGFSFGGAAGLSLNLGEEKEETENVACTSYQVGVGYTANDSTAALMVENKDDLKYQFSFFRQHSDNIAFAATLGGKTDSGSAQLEFGGSYNIDADTTGYSKLTFPDGNTSSATAAFLVDSQLCTNTKLGLTAVLPLDFQSAPQFGLNMNFGV